MLPVVTGEFRVVADPELRFAPSGVAVGKMRAVASSRKKDDNGDWQDDKTCWVNLVGFKKVAENMAETFQKSDLVLVTGKMETDEWEDKDGGKRTSVNIIVDIIGPSIVFNPARVMRSESGNTKTAAAIDRSKAAADPSNDPWTTAGTTPADSDPPF